MSPRRGRLVAGAERHRHRARRTRPRLLGARPPRRRLRATTASSPSATSAPPRSPGSPAPGQLLWDVGAGAGLGRHRVDARRTPPAARSRSRPIADRAARIGATLRRSASPTSRSSTGRAPAALSGLERRTRSSSAAAPPARRARHLPRALRPAAAWSSTASRSRPRRCLRGVRRPRRRAHPASGSSRCADRLLHRLDAFSRRHPVGIDHRISAEAITRVDPPRVGACPPPVGVPRTSEHAEDPDGPDLSGDT